MREYLLKDLEPITSRQIKYICKVLSLNISIRNGIVYVSTKRVEDY